MYQHLHKKVGSMYLHLPFVDFYLITDFHFTFCIASRTLVLSLLLSYFLLIFLFLFSLSAIIHTSLSKSVLGNISSSPTRCRPHWAMLADWFGKGDKALDFTLYFS